MLNITFLGHYTNIRVLGYEVCLWRVEGEIDGILEEFYYVLDTYMKPLKTDKGTISRNYTLVDLVPVYVLTEEMLPQHIRANKKQETPVTVAKRTRRTKEEMAAARAAVGLPPKSITR